VRILLSVGAEMSAYLGDALVRRAHKGFDSLGIGHIEYLENRGGVLKAHRLRARLFFGHVIDAEELIIADENSVHDAVSQEPRCYRTLPCLERPNNACIKPRVLRGDDATSL